MVGLPKTIDGDLKNEHIGTSFGFDTAISPLYLPHISLYLTSFGFDTAAKL